MQIKPELKEIVHTIKINDDELDDIYKGLRLLSAASKNKTQINRVNDMILQIEKIGERVDEATDTIKG